MFPTNACFQVITTVDLNGFSESCKHIRGILASMQIKQLSQKLFLIIYGSISQ